MLRQRVPTGSVARLLEIPPGGMCPAGMAAEVLPLVMRFDGTEWRVLNLGSERIPQPGIPPILM